MQERVIEMITFNNIRESKEYRNNTLILCKNLVPLMIPKEIAAVLKVMDKVVKRLERGGRYDC